MASAWPAFRESAIRQWHGLTEQERDVFEQIIARRDHAGFGGCIMGGALVDPQIVLPIWTSVSPLGESIDLVAMKADLL